MKPYISVIITDFNRKDFILNAVKSAVNQSIHRSYYEVIVVKNYIDDKIDKILNNLGVKVVNTKDENQGKMIYDAVTIAEGEVLSFLDDDDEFLNNKLERVILFFSKYDVDYHKNLRIFIDKKGNYIKKEDAYDKPLFVDNDEICKKINILMRNGIMVNSSTISIRKEIIEKEKELLKKLPLGVDSFFFTSFVKHGRRLVLDNNYLTLYRVHANQSFMDRHNFEKFAIKRLESAKKFIISYSMLLEALENSINCQRSCILKYITSLLLRSKIVYNIYGSLLGHGTSYKISIFDIIHLFKYPMINSDNIFDYLKLYMFVLLNYFPRPFKYIGAKLEYNLNKSS